LRKKRVFKERFRMGGVGPKKAPNRRQGQFATVGKKITEGGGLSRRSKKIREQKTQRKQSTNRGGDCAQRYHVVKTENFNWGEKARRGEGHTPVGLSSHPARKKRVYRSDNWKNKSQNKERKLRGPLWFGGERSLAYWLLVMVTRLGHKIPEKKP